ncbi:MAG: hypothetical protein JNK33_01870 [Candidatus Doudnabacteria bacterium]|nr:hypothetical protein [Candidatus Doudnabacteria bacterium]
MQNKRKQHKLTKKPQKVSEKIRGWLRRRSKAELVLGVVVILVTGYLANHQIDVYREKQMYNAAERDIHNFVDAAAKLMPSTKKMIRYCTYGSEKYSKGGLSCTVEGDIEYLPLDESQIKEVVSSSEQLEPELPWEFLFDNTEGNQKYTSSNYLKSVVYKKDRLRCSIHFTLKEDDQHSQVVVNGKSILRLSTGCNGSALKEYY